MPRFWGAREDLFRPCCTGFDVDGRAVEGSNLTTASCYKACLLLRAGRITGTPRAAFDRHHPAHCIVTAGVDSVDEPSEHPTAIYTHARTHTRERRGAMSPCCVHPDPGVYYDCRRSSRAPDDFEREWRKHYMFGARG